MISTTESKPSDSATANARTRLPRRRRCRTWKANPSTRGYSVVDFVRTQFQPNSSCYSQQLDEKAAATRRIFANVLKVKAWEIRISRTPERLENPHQGEHRHLSGLRIRQAKCRKPSKGVGKRLVLQGRPRKGRHHGVPRRPRLFLQ